MYPRQPWPRARLALARPPSLDIAVTPENGRFLPAVFHAHPPVRPVPAWRLPLAAHTPWPRAQVSVLAVKEKVEAAHRAESASPEAGAKALAKLL